MSDYAGPILGAVGAVVGGYFGGAKGAQWGWAIGSAIGGAYSASQQVIPGPKIGDTQNQTSQEGGFRPIVYGRSMPIGGNIIADGGPNIVTSQERQGKGGPKVESESAYRTYAVGVCEGEASLLQAWRNGILVFDAEDGSMAAENAKFREYATWYTGSFSQSASPDLEEIYGAGQAPFFRGTAYLSIHNEDVTDQRGAWSQWQFRVFRGAAKSYTTPPYLLDAGTEAIEPAYSIVRADIRDLHYGFSDAAGSEYSLEHAEIRTVFQQYTDWPAESVGSSYSLISAQIGSPLSSYVVQPEEITAGYSLQAIDLRVTLITYTYWPAEGLSHSYSLQSAVIA